MSSLSTLGLAQREFGWVTDEETTGMPAGHALLQPPPVSRRHVSLSVCVCVCVCVRVLLIADILIWTVLA